MTKSELKMLAVLIGQVVDQKLGNKVTATAKQTPKVSGKTSPKVIAKVTPKVSAKSSPKQSFGSIFVKDGSKRPYVVGKGGYGVRVGFNAEGVAHCNDQSVLDYLGENEAALQEVYDLYTSRV